MTRLKFGIVIMAIVCLSSFCMAESNQQTHKTQNSPIVLVRKNTGAHTIRPKTPDMQMITCEYDGKGISLNLVLPEGSSTMTVTDIQGEGGVYTIDTSALEVYVPVGELSYPIHVQLETETDKIYEGVFKE